MTTPQQELARTYVRFGAKVAEIGDLAAARSAFEAAIRHAPAWEEPHFRLGTLKLAAGDPSGAEIAFRATLKLRHSHFGARQNLGVALRLLGRFEEAIEVYRWLTARTPADPAHWRNLSTALSEAWELDAAESAVLRALQLAPGDVGARHGLSLILSRKGNWEGAIDSIRKALRDSAKDPHCHVLLALALLTTGQFEEGWREFEWRNRHGVAAPDLPGTAWTGGPVSGKTLLLFGEQGLGDAIQFSRYATLLAARGATVILGVDERLERILATIDGVSATVTGSERLPHYDFHVSMMSVPYFLNTALQSIPSRTPYITPPQTDVMRWSERLRQDAGLKVGLVWAGDGHANDPSARSIDRRRSIPLQEFLPIIELDGVTFVSLQKGPQETQIGSLPPGRKVLTFMSEIDDFCGTAALIESLDLVISVDTSVAHMAGALGKPVWLLSRCDGCWRWLLDREDSPWYPRMKIYRQKEVFQWKDVIRAVHFDLREMLRLGN